MSMRSRRQKRKAASLQLNFIEPKKKGRSISMKRISFPFGNTPSSSSSSTQVPCSTNMSSPEPTGSFSDEELSEVTGPNLVSNEPRSEESHTQRKTKAAEAWTEIRHSLLSSFTALFGFPSTPVTCVFCADSKASVWCQDCGPSAYFCVKCTTKLHESINIFHHPLLWKEVDHVYTRFPRQITISARCSCSSTYQRELKCVNEKGYFHIVRVTFCGCTSEAVTLISAGLFPATPKQPKLAFTFALLDLFEALLLECQVSAQDFVAAIGFLSDVQMFETEKCHLYPIIIDCFEEYRYMKYTHRQLRVIVPDRFNDSTKCPACPKDSQVFYSIDGNFGLCRKKSSGKSVRPPLHDDLMFMKQEAVDEYVRCYGKIEAQIKKECNQFLASDVLRSKSRYKALDETGVVGVVCRHEFPFKLLSMHHGERLSYIVYTLEKVLESTQVFHKEVYLLYDVACTLYRHLQIQGRHDLLGYFKFAIPIFHSYGHKVDCQFQYSPRNVSGFGLTDGEGVERLWSYLRRFSRMTKEMRPSHRIDVLTDALLHYAQQAIKRLCSLLPLRMDKARKLQHDSKRELEELMASSPVKYSTTDVMQWYKEECEQTRCQNLLENEETRWEVNYFILLKAYYQAQHELQMSTPNCIRAVNQRLIKLDADLKRIEQCHQMERWTNESDIFQDYDKMEQKKEQERVARDIKTCARERWFLLKIKAKFADGQYMASRLSKKINCQGTQLKKLITRYNSLAASGDMILTWSQATDLSTCAISDHSLSTVPRAIRLSSIKHHHLGLRADEEVCIIQSEMKCCLTFFLDDWKCLSCAALELKSRPGSKFYNGALYQVQKTQIKCEQLLLKMRSAFSQYVDNLPSIPVDQFLESNIRVHYLSLSASEPSDRLIDDETILHNEFNSDSERMVDSDSDEEMVDSDSDEEMVDSDSDEEMVDNDSDEEMVDNDSSEEMVDNDSGEGVVDNDSSEECTLAEIELSAGDHEVVPKAAVPNPLRSKSSTPSVSIRPPSLKRLLKPARRSIDVGPVNCAVNEPQPAVLSSHQPESEDSDGGDFFPSSKVVQERILRLEREEFIKQQSHSSEIPLSDNEKHVLSLLSKSSPGHVRNRGFLHRNQHKLQRVVKSAMQSPKGPHFIPDRATH